VISFLRSRKLMLTLAVTLGVAACLLVAVVYIVSGPDRAAVYATVAGLPTAVIAAVAAVLALAADPKPPSRQSRPSRTGSSTAQTSSGSSSRR
jgi:hypothetical protein